MEKDYILLRSRYLPKKVRLVFVLESPPAGHGFIYDASGRTGEVLFRAFMKLFDLTPTNKEEGLRALAKQGVILTNPIYEAVNKLSDKEANAKILGNYEAFVEDLRSLGVTSKTPLILIKKNIFELLRSPLLADGFNVLNTSMIPFPLHYHARAFEEKCRGLIGIRWQNPTSRRLPLGRTLPQPIHGRTF
jgi:hypothetical protein